MNSAVSNAENEALDIDICIREYYHWESICDEVVRGESGQVEISKKLGLSLLLKFWRNEKIDT